MRVNYVIVFVPDMPRSVAFYRDVVGLPLPFESPSWSEFEGGQTTLALHASKAPAERGNTPVDLPAGYCRPGFAVTDLAAFHGRMVQHGVRCLEEPKPVQGVLVAQYVDPDGLGFSVSEPRH